MAPPLFVFGMTSKFGTTFLQVQVSKVPQGSKGTKVKETKHVRKAGKERKINQATDITVSTPHDSFFFLKAMDFS